MLQPWHVARSRPIRGTPAHTICLVPPCWLSSSGEEAKQSLLEAIRIQPQYPQALGNLAVAHYELGEKARALGLLIEALEQKIDYSDGWSNYLTILSRELIPRDGLDRLPLPPDDEDAARWHWGAAMTAMKAGNAQQSTRHFLRSLSLDLNDPNVHNDFAVLLRQVDRKALALPFLKAASALAPGLEIGPQ